MLAALVVVVAATLATIVVLGRLVPGHCIRDAVRVRHGAIVVTGGGRFAVGLLGRGCRDMGMIVDVV
jgi:hypothetical protein